MTSDNAYEVHVLPSFVPVFWCFAGVSVGLCYYALQYAAKYSTTAAFLLTPFICVCLVFDNAVMASTGIDRRRTSTQAMLAFHACVTPMLLLVCYELSYLVHKQRAVAFCGITFDRSCDYSGNEAAVGSRMANKRRGLWLSTCLRILVWLVACGLLVLNLLVAYHWASNLSPEVTSLYAIQGDNVAHAVSAIVPAVVLVILALYVGLQLWNYGTHYSYTVHATCCNPWIWMLVGAIALLVGYLMPSPLYALSSNAGEVVMMATIVRMFREVHDDIQQGLQFGEFVTSEGAASPRQGLPHLNACLMSWHKSAGPSKTDAEQPIGYTALSTPNERPFPVTLAHSLRRDQARYATSSANAANLSVVVDGERTNQVPC
ncbi:unnamed protein product [Hyaloperonospora brassicae]|uniref:Membrane-associated protein n=1 Tax=Hyaloperonospora brassicae TaxID=162125 RepID=A0AAV0UYQ9_HYABA|nr:unnamed protein product [Hyaloperonospora brassicae]